MVTIFVISKNNYFSKCITKSCTTATYRSIYCYFIDFCIFNNFLITENKQISNKNGENLRLKKIRNVFESKPPSGIFF